MRPTFVALVVVVTALIGGVVGASVTHFADRDKSTASASIRTVPEILAVLRAVTTPGSPSNFCAVSANSSGSEELIGPVRSKSGTWYAGCHLRAGVGITESAGPDCHPAAQVCSYYYCLG
jgi:hypothetical protein